MKTNFHLFIAAAGFITIIVSPALASPAFEGRINAVVKHGDETTALLYTAETNSLRVEVASAHLPNPVNLVNRKTGDRTLVFPHNRSYVKLRAGKADASPDAAAAKSLVKQTMSSPMRPPSPTGGPTVPGGLSSLPTPTRGISPQATPASALMSSMPMVVLAREKLELKATGEKTNILGLACVRYELKQLGDTLEVWATDQMLPYQPYVRNQMPGQGPRGIQELWPELLASRNLFPLRAMLRHGQQEQFNFAVTSISRATFSDADASLFEPPSDYLEIQPLPF